MSQPVSNEEMKEWVSKTLSAFPPGVKLSCTVFVILFAIDCLTPWHGLDLAASILKLGMQAACFHGIIILSYEILRSRHSRLFNFTYWSLFFASNYRVYGDECVTRLASMLDIENFDVLIDNHETISYVVIGAAFAYFFLVPYQSYVAYYKGFSNIPAIELLHLFALVALTQANFFFSGPILFMIVFAGLYCVYMPMAQYGNTKQ